MEDIEKGFLDLTTFIPQETPTTPLDEPKNLKLLRFNLGIVVKRYFDALEIDERRPLGAALLELGAIWESLCLKCSFGGVNWHMDFFKLIFPREAKCA